ncbi:hypothetical protein F5876DRAFT_79259 [Lentinula aff. lateritia]|uniref:Uncharacterized protein n=1 Tax=Lentinula aff. lateritia TaxID=2804960 RepID=A0ACC1TT42_9AGAR|nr:hypothetical protein F5876DRAFT_79259 [Lentinula aff. lateritia]
MHSALPTTSGQRIETSLNILNQAKDRPTGTGERKQLYFDALAAEKGISGKVSLGDIQDDDDDSNNDSEDDEDIMDISSESEHNNDSKVVKKKGKKQVETVLTKVYKMEAPLCPPPRKTQSANFLDKLSITLDPQALQQHDENQTTASFQLLMLQNYQTQVATLTSQVNEERRHADDAEAELRMYRMLDLIMDIITSSPLLLSMDFMVIVSILQSVLPTHHIPCILPHVPAIHTEHAGARKNLAVMPYPEFSLTPNSPRAPVATSQLPPPSICVP